MRSMKDLVTLGSVAAVSFIAASGLILLQTTASADDDPAIALKKVFDANLEATEKEDMPAVLKTIHPKSPVVENTERACKQIFANYDLKYQILEFKYLVSDGGYAIARVRQKTTKVAGPQFRDNTVTSIAIFKQEDKDWKIWQQAVLEIKYD